jgi:hypothetical protein
VLPRQVVSKDVFIKMNALKDQRRGQHWTRVEWELLDADKLSKNVTCVQARWGGVSQAKLRPWTESNADCCISAACLV